MLIAPWKRLYRAITQCAERLLDTQRLEYSASACQRGKTGRDPLLQSPFEGASISQPVSTSDNGFYPTLMHCDVIYPLESTSARDGGWCILVLDIRYPVPCAECADSAEWLVRIFSPLPLDCICTCCSGQSVLERVEGSLCPFRDYDLSCPTILKFLGALANWRTLNPQPSCSGKRVQQS